MVKGKLVNQKGKMQLSTIKPDNGQNNLGYKNKNKELMDQEPAESNTDTVNKHMRIINNAETKSERKLSTKIKLAKKILMTNKKKLGSKKSQSLASIRGEKSGKK